MEAGEFELKLIEFFKEERSCNMIMIFLNHNMDIKTTKVAEITRVLHGIIQKIKKLTCETRKLRTVISHKKVSQENVRWVSTIEFINQVQKMMNGNPLRLLVFMVHELQCIDMTVRACAKEDLCCKSYRMQIRQF